MVSIRRNVGAFAVAAAIAAVMIAAPAPVQARTARGGDTLGTFCAQLKSSIDYIASLPSNLATDLTLLSLNATYGTFCQ